MTQSPFHTYDPDYVIAPSETLREWLDDHGFTDSDWAEKLFGGEVIPYVLAKREITELHAVFLHMVTGIPGQVWLNLDHNYRVGLAAGKKDISEPPPDPSRVEPGIGTIGCFLFVVFWLAVFAFLFYGYWTTSR